MRYISTNHLSDFEFHDSEWELRSRDEHNLILEVRLLNIHSTAPQNPHKTDMEIELAQMTFAGFSILSFDPGRAWKTDANGNSYTEDPIVIYEGKEAEARFLAELDHGNHGVTVFNFQCEGKTHFINACGNEPWFTVQFHFDSVKIEWDTYKKPAWYTEHKWSK